MSLPRAVADSLSRLRERAGVRVRALRNQATDAEQLLWLHLRNRQLGGFKFRRQHRISSFIADFACIEAGLVIELDGGQHFEPEGEVRDARRTSVMRESGFSVLRFDNRQVLTQTQAVLTAILVWLEPKHPHPNPHPQAGEGATTGPSAQAEKVANVNSLSPLGEKGNSRSFT